MDTFKDLEKAVLAKVCNHGTRSLRKGWQGGSQNPIRNDVFYYWCKGSHQRLLTVTYITFLLTYAVARLLPNSSVMPRPL